MQDPKRIKSLAGTPVVTQVNKYFTELFNERPELEELRLTEETLISDLQARFQKVYDAKAIAALLQNGYLQADGTFLFKHDDFILPLKNRLEGVAL